MRQVKLYVMLTVMLLLGSVASATAAGPRKAYSESEGAFLLKTSDGLEQYTVDGSVTFKAVADGKNIPTGRDCGVVFTPKNPGEQIQITVNSIDLDESKAYLLLYDGAIEKIGSGASDGNGQAPFLPSGWVKKYNSSSAGETYTSTAADGKLSFGFHSGWSVGNLKGFNITVTSVSPKDMEYVGATMLTNVADVYRGQKDQAIAGLSVVTDGGKNALTLDELGISTAGLDAAQVSNVRLYRGTTYSQANLLATAATVGDVLKASNVTLKSGDNRFMVVADISASAKGTISGLTATSLKVAGQDRTLTATRGNDVKIANIILMPSEATTYEIDDNGALFYDDGGKDGKISLNFTGQVTFVPATAGKAIKIDFSKLAIFNTSSIGKNDVLKFYNGRTADESNLITTLLKDAETVKSTAPDGSMTVTLTSITGVPADGWEATVSQFKPGNMALSGITAATAGTDAVTSGQKDVQTLVVDVQTDNTLNPLTVTGFNLSTSNAKNLESARIYYLGHKNEFAADKAFGQAAVSGNAISVSGTRELIEGHNYFAVVLDLNDQALNGETIDLALQSVTVDGAAQAPTQAVTVSRTVSNICHATQGSHRHVIRDAWQFTDTKSTYGSGYETENTDYIVTFTPAEAGAVAQIDFSKFDLYYSTGYYGVQAVFEIYSGTEVNEANLLWKLSSASEASTGPGTMLQSKAADGSLTIRFNPKTDMSYYSGTGWEATVTPFKNHEMTVTDIAVSQTSTSVLPVGAKGAGLIDWAVTTQGTLTSLKVKNFKLKLAGREALSAVHLAMGDSANIVASDNTLASDEITLNLDTALSGGENRFWLTVDVKDDAASDVVVDAALLSMTDGLDSVHTVVVGDPAGARTVKALLNMTSGNSVVTVTNPFMFYDDGGADGPMTRNFSGTVTFVPGRKGCAVQISPKEFSTGSGYVYIYNGNAVDADSLVGKYNYSQGPGYVLSSAPSGALTVRVTGPTSTTTQFDGFAMEVSLHQLTDLKVDSIVATPVTTNAVVRGSQSAPLTRLAVVVSGDLKQVKLNGLTFSTAGTTALSDVTGARLYYTGKINNFNDMNPVATVTNPAASTWEFQADSAITITANGTHYLWLAVDVASDATVGNQIAATFTGVSGATGSVIEAATAARAIKAGLSGNYVIGKSANANYATFAAAVEAVSGGIEGPVTFLVEDGSYAENIALRSIAGTSEQHPLVFKSQSGDRAKVTITGSGYTEPAYGGHKEGMVLIDNTPWVKFVNMTFEPTSQSYPIAVHVYNQSRHFTLDSCAVKAQTSTNFRGMHLVETEAVDQNGKNNDYCTVQNSQFQGGYIALYMGGTSIVAYQRETGLKVLNNTISEPGSKGVYVTDEDDLLISGNTITASQTTKAGYWGIDLFRVRGRFSVCNNVIVNQQTAYSGGIDLRQESWGVSEDEPGLVYNNAISITQSPSNSSAGIEMDGDNKNVHFIYNTVRVAGEGGYTFYSARARSNASFTGVRLVNNLMQNLTPAPQFYFYGSYASQAQFEANALHQTSGNVLSGSDMAAFVQTYGESNIADSAQFVSTTDLSLKAAGKLQAALPLDYIATDLKGNQRDSAKPTIGAYEYREVVVVTPEIAQGFPRTVSVTDSTIAVRTRWNVSGKLYSKIEPITAAAQAPRRVATVDELLATEPVDYTAQADADSRFSGLEPSGKYQASFLLVSALDGSRSAVVVSDTIETLRHIDTLRIDLTNPYDVITAGTTYSIVPPVTGGDKPYTYEWRDQLNQVVGTDSILTVTPDYTWGYKLTVRSADGQTATAKTGLWVLDAPTMGTFDDVYVDTTGYNTGDFQGDVIYSGSYALHVNNMGFWWDGYGVSSQQENTFATLDDQYHSAPGGGVDGSNYCIAYPDGFTIDVTNNLDGDSLQGVYVTNNAYAINSMTNGDRAARKFKTGDWFLLTIVGTHADGSTSSTTCYLADYRSNDEADHYMLQDWKWIDLSSLGAVTSLQFNLTSSDVGKWGMNTPAYVCIDNLNSPDPNATSVNTVDDATAKVVSKVTYVNMAGAVSDRPFSGVNIVVTRYTDGSMKAMKVIK